MKKLTFIFLTLSFLFAVSLNSDAQSLKDLKKKAKSTENKLKNTTKNSDGKNETSTESTKKEETENPVKNVTKDQEYIDFVDEAYKTIWTREMSTSEISDGAYFMDVKKHIEMAKEFNYPAVTEKLKEKGLSGGVSERNFKSVASYGEYYKKAYEAEDGIKNSVNRLFDEAYKVRQNNPREAINHIEKARDWMTAIEIVLPDFEDHKELKAEIEKAFDDIAGPYYAKVFTSDFHKENAGKILFSDKPIIIGQEDPNQFKTDFTVNDKIYGMIYLASTIEHQTGKSGQYYVTWDGGGGANYSNILFKHPEGRLDDSYHPIEIIPDPAVAVNDIDAQQFARILGNLSPRKHPLNIQYTGTQNVSGEINIDLSGMDVNKLKADAETAVANAEDNFARSRKLPAYFSQKSYSFKDADMSEAKIRAMLQKQWKNCAKITKIVVLESHSGEEWRVSTNDLGVPRYKYSWPEILAVYEGKDGWCYYVKNISFKRDYQGGGNYGSVIFYNDDNRHYKMDCKNVK